MKNGVLSPAARRVLRGFALLVGVLLIILRIRAMVVSQPQPPGSDAAAYVTAARALREGTNPYDLPSFRDAAAQGESSALPYLYPPLLAVLAMPLTQLPIGTASLAFVVLAFVAAIVLCLMLRRSFGWTAAVAMVFLFLPTWATIYFGQIGFVIAILVQLALEGMTAERPLLTAIALSLGTLFKLTPGLGLVVLLQRRQWAALLAGFAAAGVVVVLTLPYASLQRWLEGSLIALRTNWQVWWLASWTGILTYRLPPPYGEALSAILALTALIYTLLRLKKLPGELALSALLLLPLLFGRVVWGHHAVTALPVLAVLWRRSPGNRLLVILAWTLITFLDFYGLAPALTLCWAACVWPEQTAFLERLHEKLASVWLGSPRRVVETSQG